MRSTPPSPGPWWRADRHADRRPKLLARRRIVQAIRRLFEAWDFVEVDTPVLQVSGGNEPHLHAFETVLEDTAGRPAGTLQLHTSPEFTMKKLLAAGEERIFTLAHVFRNREATTLHHPEFTMLEWYRTHDPYAVLIDDCAALLAATAAAGCDRLTWRGHDVPVTAGIERLTVHEAFERHLGIDLFAVEERPAFAEAAGRAGIRVAADDGWSDIFSRAMVEIEPKLGLERPTALVEYPIREAALARPSAADPRVAERFELYCCGVELANAFGELTDPHEQRRRFEADMALKERTYGRRPAIDEDFLAALHHMPPASGIALGFDRLVMLATGARHVDEVLWAPVGRPAVKT